MGVLLIYDVGSQISFDNIRSWMRNVEQNAAKTVNKVRGVRVGGGVVRWRTCQPRALHPKPCPAAVTRQQQPFMVSAVACTHAVSDAALLHFPSDPTRLPPIHPSTSTRHAAPSIPTPEPSDPDR